MVDTKKNLCDTCINSVDMPMCTSEDIKFGDGYGNDNIIECNNYEVEGLENGCISLGEFDVVLKPQHYADKQIEVIDYMEDTLSKEGYEGFCTGNVLKYVSRYRHKNGVEDLKKARFYLNKAIESLEEGD